MNQQNTKMNQENLEEMLHNVANTLQPSKIDKIAAELDGNFETAQALLGFMNQGLHVKEVYQLLIRLNVKDIVPLLEELLDSSSEIVRHYAMLTLSDMSPAAKSLKLGDALYMWLRQIASPPQNEKDAIATMKVIKRLVEIKPIEPDLCTRLQSLLFYIPQGAYRESLWPRTWVEASRQLRDLGCLDKLQEISCSQKTHYLSAAGAIALAGNGFVDGDVYEWLRNTRDYYLLDVDEQQELEELLIKIGGSDQELAALRKQREN